ncbi:MULTISPECIES: hypothetical protein [Enterobacter]|uniref:hypothetical protein n=1 Tax=Enterobacter TaxID=547 RepID=UPI000DCC8BF7|nr:MULTISPECIES: hypothetical protein [Enterobacter]QLY00908.1 hypothetical protein HV242_24110 [Enterobacter sp. RHBSTW-00593]RAY76653.1 hypothetical protein DP199_03030 [Enterobacter kobei]
MLTFNDVNRDFKAILEGISDTNRPVPSTSNALKVAFILPLIGVVLSAITFGVVCAISNHREFSIGLLSSYILSGNAIPVYMAIVVGFIQGLMLLPYVSLFHSIPQNVRESTPLIAHMKRAIFKGTVFYIATLLFTCLMSYYDAMYLFSTPIVMIMSIIAASITVNLQVSKFGVGALIDKLMKNLR